MNVCICNEKRAICTPLPSSLFLHVAHCILYNPDVIWFNSAIINTDSGDEAKYGPLNPVPHFNLPSLPVQTHVQSAAYDPEGKVSLLCMYVHVYFHARVCRAGHFSRSYAYTSYHEVTLSVSDLNTPHHHSPIRVHTAYLPP